MFSQIDSAHAYQQLALRTQRMDGDGKLTEGLMGLAGEAGEAIDILKKHLYQGHPLDKLHLAEELGDVAWYLAVSAWELGYDLNEIFAKNINKLRERYPNGFEEERSICRDGNGNLYYKVEEPKFL